MQRSAWIIDPTATAAAQEAQQGRTLTEYVNPLVQLEQDVQVYLKRRCRYSQLDVQAGDMYSVLAGEIVRCVKSKLRSGGQTDSRIAPRL